MRVRPNLRVYGADELTLVIHAMRTLPAAEIVAYTNAGIVLATAMSLVVFRERTQWQQRAVAAGVVCAGLACIGVGRAL